MKFKLILVITMVAILFGCLAQEEKTASKFGQLRMGTKIEERGNNKVLVRIFIKNVGNSTVRVAMPIYFVTLKFQLYKGNETLKFKGPVPTYLPLTEKQTKILKPGEGLETEYLVDLCWWNVSKGKYTLSVIYDTINVESRGTDFVRVRFEVKQNVTANKTC